LGSACGLRGEEQGRRVQAREQAEPHALAAKAGPVGPGEASTLAANSPTWMWNLTMRSSEVIFLRVVMSILPSSWM
jgi:hypothetical protein